jgi:hypothetical protein
MGLDNSGCLLPSTTGIPGGRRSYARAPSKKLEGYIDPLITFLEEVQYR